MRSKIFIGGVLAWLCTQAQAQLKPLDDMQLSTIDGGAGIGLVLENFKVDAQNLNIVINDITNTAGQNIPIAVNKLYVAATGSNKGNVLNPVTIGRLPYPINVNLAAGEDLFSFQNGSQVQTTPAGVTVAELAFPAQLTAANGGQACITGVSGNNTCSSSASAHMDMGLRLEFNVAANRTDIFSLDLADAVMDGTYLRVWGDSVSQQMVGEVRLNLFAKALDVMNCKAGASNCNTVTLQNEKTLQLSQINASVGLGYGKSQPILFDVSSDGQFVLELPNPVRDTASPAVPVNTTTGAGLTRANDFYANAPRIHFSVGNFTLGGTRATTTSVPTGGYNMGLSQLTGMGFNYLKVTSRDL